MSDTPMRERLARAAFMSLAGEVHTTEWEFGAGSVNLSPETKESYRKMVAAILQDIEAQGFQITKRIPHKGKVS